MDRYAHRNTGANRYPDANRDRYGNDPAHGNLYRYAYADTNANAAPDGHLYLDADPCPCRLYSVYRRAESHR